MGLTELYALFIDNALALFIMAGIIFFGVQGFFWLVTYLAQRQVFHQLARRRLFTALFAIGIASFFFIISPTLDTTDKMTITAKIVWKERVSYGTLFQEHKYLIFTLDEGGYPIVVENTDNYAHGKHNSSDVYAMLEVGRVYKLYLIGKRVPLFSKYPNILRFERVDAKQ